MNSTNYTIYELVLEPIHSSFWKTSAMDIQNHLSSVLINLLNLGCLFSSSLPFLRILWEFVIIIVTLDENNCFYTWISSLSQILSVFVTAKGFKNPNPLMQTTYFPPNSGWYSGCEGMMQMNLNSGFSWRLKLIDWMIFV
jgi:hypothetical protein